MADSVLSSMGHGYGGSKAFLASSTEQEWSDIRAANSEIAMG